jgi:hypothetical protein
MIDAPSHVPDKALRELSLEVREAPKGGRA